MTEFNPELFTPPPELASAVNRARYLLLTTRNVTLSTVGIDPVTFTPRPHGTVLSAGFRSSLDMDEPPLRFYSWSFPDTRHALNLENSGGEVDLTVVKSFSSGKALNLYGTMEQVPTGKIDEWLPVLNSLRKMFRMGKRELEDFNPEITEHPKALYYTNITGASVSNQRCNEGRWTGDVAEPLNLDWLRGFEGDSWRMRWLREIGAAAIHRVSNAKP
jgi:hypothetical protein